MSSRICGVLATWPKALDIPPARAMMAGVEQCDEVTRNLRLRRGEPAARVDEEAEKEMKGTSMKKSLGAKMVPTAPVWVVGSYDRNGKPNVMTAAWAGICCSKPPCLTVSLRKATYTYGNIMARKAYTVNMPSEACVREMFFLKS